MCERPDALRILEGGSKPSRHRCQMWTRRRNRVSSFTDRVSPLGTRDGGRGKHSGKCVLKTGMAADRAICEHRVNPDLTCRDAQCVQLIAT